MANVLYMPAAMKDLKHVFEVSNDFAGNQVDTDWVDTVTDSGTVSFDDLIGGQAVLTPSDCTIADNDEAYLATPNEIFKLTAGLPMYFEARIKYAETVASTQNIAFGIQNAVGANSIIDTAGGLKVSGDTIAIYKAETANLKCVSVSNGGTATVSTSSFTPTAGTFYTYSIEVMDYTSTLAKVAFSIDGVRLKDSTTGLDIVHTVAYASSTECQLFVGVKLGAGTNNDTMTVDYIYGCQARV